MRIQWRSPVLIITFSILTGGLYGIYWYIQTKEEMNSLGADIPTVWLLIVPIANWYFLYKYSEGFSYYVKRDSTPVLWFLLAIVIEPVFMILVQLELNKLAS